MGKFGLEILKVEIVLILIEDLFLLNQKYYGSQGKTGFYTMSILYIGVKLSAGKRRIAHLPWAK